MRIRSTRLSLLALALGCNASSSATSVPQRACGLTVWYMPSSASDTVSVIGSWDGWQHPGTSMPAGRSDGWRVVHLAVPPGEYEYAIVDDDVQLTDPNVATLAMRDGEEVSWTEVPDCSVPALTVASGTGSATGAAKLDVAFLASSTGSPMDPSTFVATHHDGTKVPASDVTIDPSTGGIVVKMSGLAPGKHAITMAARDASGIEADPAVGTVWIEPHPFQLEDTVIYQVVVDRFRDAAGFLPAPAYPSARAGGTIAGVKAAIDAGYFQSLGANTLWISPLYEGPPGTWPGADGRPYTDYHGYWPAQERELEPSQTDVADLNTMIDSAHAHGLRVLFDVVPNHVHIDNPYWTTNKANDWFNHPDGQCICGSATCGWATHIIDCWFTPYLADLAWQNPQVADQLSSDVRWWMDSFDGDGVRIDAVPMMWRLATRRIVNAIRSKYDHPGNRSFLLGENYVGEGDFSLLQYELGPQGLDSEFHFPLLWALQSNVAQGQGKMSDLDAVIHAGETAWAGSGAVMSLILGNQDVPRFSSVSAGDAYGDTWVAAPQSNDPTVYARQQLAFGIVFALPGAPTIYYGDEVGLAGGGDPDSRRVMPSDGELSPLQLATRAWVQKLGAARSCLGALREGSFRTLHAGDEDWEFVREAPGVEPVVAVVLRRPAGPVTVSLPGVGAGNYVDLLSGKTTSLNPRLTKLEGGPFSTALYVPAGSPCAVLAQP